MAAAAILETKLDMLRVEKPHIIRGADKQLKELKDQVCILRSIAFPRRRRPIETDILRDLRSKAIELVLQCNFIIDTFIPDIEVSIRTAGVLRKIFIRCFGKFDGLSKFKEEIGFISREIREIVFEIKIETRPFCDEQPERAKQGPPIVKESDVVGLEGDVELLLNNVTRRYASMISIVGMGGIGKTTLASILYHHPVVAAHFERRVWITLSMELSNEDDILKELIAVLWKAIECEGDVIFYHSLHEQVCQLLRHRKYFIVLDDAWGGTNSFNFWYTFSIGSSSTLVVTSRKQDASCGSSSLGTHELKLLDAKKSWQMFSKKAFAGESKCPKHLEEIGKQIVKKCDGLPLAIEEAAELLQGVKAEPQAWEKFLESMDLKKTSASLELSYINLDPKYKPHFLSLAFFREGTTVRAEKLLQVWVAGDLVPYIGYERYKNGEELLNYLINQSLIQVKDKTIANRVKNCVINNNVRRLAISKAMEEIKLEVLTKGRSYDRSFGKRHHLVIHCSREKFKYSLEHDQKLVSLFFHGGGGVDASPSHWKNLKVLKILDWEGFGLKSLPMGVETLISLKYLGLRNNYVQEVPCSLGQLKKLEVLDIAQNFLVEVPDIMHEMDSLSHLHMSDIISQNPLKIHSLKNLRTLTYISLDNWAYMFSGLKMMTSLRKLGIEEVDGNTDVQKLFASVAESRKVKHLILKGFRFKRMPEIEEVPVVYGFEHLKMDGLLTRLPWYILSDVRCLSLVNSRLDDDPMPTLKNMCWLLHLKLQNTYSGKQLVFPCRKFSSLRSLTIKELWHLRSLQVEKGALQRLEKLEIVSCPYLETLPKEIAKMEYLEELNMVTTTRIATMIRKSSFISKIQKVDIQP